MSERSVRKSTQDLRNCYHDSRSRSRSRVSQARRRIRTEKNTSPSTETPESRETGMAEPAPQQTPAAEPGQTNGQPTQVGGEVVVDIAQVHRTPVSPAKTPEHQENGHEDRITKLEQQLREYRAEKEATNKRAARSASRSTAHSPKTGRTSAPRTARSKSGRRDRTRSRSRSPSRSRRSTRSRRRSSSRRTRRSRSRSDSSSRRRRRRSTRSRSSRRSHSRRTRSRSTRTRSKSRRRDKRSTSRRDSPYKEQDLRKQTDEALAAQYPSMGDAKGKPLPIKGLPNEPYYNLPPDLRSKARARRSRSDMTFPEYMCGFLNMAAKALPKGSEGRVAIDHAAQVAQDAAGYTWPAVRQWSQTCLSHIKDTTKKWVGNDDLFTRERTRLSWIKGKPLREIRIPCDAHNTDKCNEQATHYSEGKTWVHGCAVCVYASTDDASAQAATTHTLRTCRRKPTPKYYQDDNRSDYKWRPNQQQGRKENRPDTTKPKN